MPCPLPIFSQSDYLFQIVDINSYKWQTVQIQTIWLLKNPTDLDLHCLQRQSISGFSKSRINSSYFFTICCGKSLKVHHQSTSNEYLQHFLVGKKRKLFIFPYIWSYDHICDEANWKSCYCALTSIRITVFSWHFILYGKIDK